MHGIKQDTKIELEQIKPYCNVYLKILLEHLYIFNQYINFNFKTIYLASKYYYQSIIWSRDMIVMDIIWNLTYLLFNFYFS